MVAARAPPDRDFVVLGFTLVRTKEPRKTAISIDFVLDFTRTARVQEFCRKVPPILRKVPQSESHESLS